VKSEGLLVNLDSAPLATAASVERTPTEPPFACKQARTVGARSISLWTSSGHAARRLLGDESSHLVTDVARELVALVVSRPCQRYETGTYAGPTADQLSHACACGMAARAAVP
jgi:hypothetical protein